MAAVWLLNSSDNVNCFSKVGECAKMLTMLYCAIAGFFYLIAIQLSCSSEL